MIERQDDLLLQAAPQNRRESAVDSAVRDLHAHAGKLAALKLDDRIELCESCAADVAAAAREWVEAACGAKKIPPASTARAEEILAGPAAVLRQLRLLSRTLSDIQTDARPHLPAAVSTVHRQLRVPVFPTKSLYDRLLFRAITAETWLQRGESHPWGENGEALARVTGNPGEKPIVTAVLGAGNVSGIPATDALSKILQESKCVVLKMNPVNEYLGAIFERAFAPLIKAGLLRIVYGGAEVGSYLVQHDGVDEVHITGSVDTHDAIVWGSNESERERDRAAGRPALNKPITSELGNVTPWAIVPGDYTDAELRFQAESIAASIVNNASFNCIATKVIVTWKQWPQRQRFLDLIDGFLREVPPRFAYYPGAEERFATFAGRSVENGEYLPWTLLRDANPDTSAHLFQRESFVCVCADTALDGNSPEDFLARAVEFMNDLVWGTLAASITVPSSWRNRDELDAALRTLRYGTIGVNQWAGVAYALMSPPWGGYPGGDLADVRSGIGFVHNTYLLGRPEKTVLYCPLRFSPKPVWFPTNWNAERVAWKLLDVYSRPSAWKLPGLFLQALRGGV